MSFEVGAGHLAIFPTMKGFRKGITKEISDTGKESSNHFNKAFKGKDLGTKFGASFKTGFAKAAGTSSDDFINALKKDASSASKQAKIALLDYKNATLNTQAAQEKLNAAISKYGADSVQAQKASITLEKAQVRQAQALDKSNTAAQKAQTAQTTLKTAQEELAKANQKLGDGLKNTAKNFINGFKGVTGPKDAVTGFTTSLGNLARQLLGIDTLWKPLGAKIATASTSILATMNGWAAQLGTKIQTGLAGAIQKAQSALAGLAGKVGAWLAPVGNALATFGSWLAKPFTAVGAAIGSKISAGLSTVSNGVAKVFQPMAAKVTGFVAPAFSAVAKTASGYMNGIKTAASGVWNALPSGVQNALTGVGSALGGIVQKTGAACKSLATSAFDGVKSIASGALGLLAAGGTALGGSILAIGKQALAAYATYEQAVGGVDTLFKDASSTVQKYAADAYKTAGISANSYMNQVTSFSASLISSLGGDTARAAEMGNMAITDMSDNANKMGTSIDSIQQTYQSLARGNYAMLDNLKLGYGGTKSEMQRLIQDANKLREANGQAGDLTIDKFSDVVQAIHEVQTNLGITGTTAKEAATTIEGSVNAMKSSWENWLSGLGQDNADMSALTQQLVESIGTALSNILPRIGQIVQGVIHAIPSMFSGLVSLLPQPFQDAINAAIGVFNNVKGMFAPLQGMMAPLTAGFAALGSQGFGALLTKLPVVGSLFSSLTGPLTFLSGPIGVLLSMLVALVATTPSLQAAFGDLVSGVLASLQNAMTALMPSIQMIMDAVMNLAASIIPLIINTLGMLIPVIQPIIDTIISVLVPVIQNIMTIATMVINTITTAIQVASPIIMAVIQGIAQIITAFMPLIQSVLGIVMSVVTAIVGEIQSRLTPVITFIAGLIQSNMGFIVGAIQGMVGVFTGIINLIGSLICGDFTGAMNAFKNIASNAASVVKNIFSGFQNMIVSVFSSAGSWLKDAGSKIIGGLVDGIKSKINDAVNAAKGVMQSIANFFPHSPAKKGPFSGRGWTPFSGQAIMTGLAEGITNSTPVAVNSIRSAMNTIHGNLAGQGNSALAVVASGSPAVQGQGVSVTQNISVPDPLAAGREGVRMLNMAIA